MPFPLLSVTVNCGTVNCAVAVPLIGSVILKVYGPGEMEFGTGNVAWKKPDPVYM